MLKNLKKGFKDLIARNRIDEAFRRLKDDVLDSASGVYNELILISARHNATERQGKLGLIDFGVKNVEFNTVNDALLWIIGRIEISDLSSKYRRKISENEHIPLQEASTCDRVDQSDMFQTDFYEKMDEKNKPRFFYLYGDSKQNHESLFERLGHDLIGIPFDYDEQSDLPSKPHFMSAKLRKAGSSMAFQIKLLAEIKKHFNSPAMGSNVLKSKISDLLKSPKLRNFDQEDFVFILLTLDDYNWDKKIIPIVVKSFIEGFCNDDLPPNAPKFFFFFAIEYSKERQSVQLEVEEAIVDSSYGEKLPLLTPVSIRDIEEWFSRNDELVSDRDFPKAAKHYFPNQDEIDMHDVERTFTQLIENYNKGYLINNFKN